MPAAQRSTARLVRSTAHRHFAELTRSAPVLIAHDAIREL